MRILVTGGFGFTGKFLLSHLLAKGNNARALKSKLDDLPCMNVEIADFNPEAVIHLAGISNTRHGNAEDFYKVNLVGSRNLLSAVSNNCSDISCVVLASTAHVYASDDGGVLSETATIKPGNDYAVSKYAMELMAGLWMNKLPIVITRPFNYTGVGQPAKFVIPKIIQHFKTKKSHISMGNTRLYREFGDVRDVVDIYTKIIEMPPLGEVINICSSQPVQLSDVVGYCEEITGHKLSIEVNPAFVRDAEPETLIGDRTKLSKYFPELKPRELRDTLSWMLSGN